MKAIPFFTEDITLVPHSASTELAHLIGQPVTLRQLQQEIENAGENIKGVSLYDAGNGELRAAASSVRRYTPIFIEGPEHKITPAD